MPGVVQLPENWTSLSESGISKTSAHGESLRRDLTLGVQTVNTTERPELSSVSLQSNRKDMMGEWQEKQEQ